MLGGGGREIPGPPPLYETLVIPLDLYIYMYMIQVNMYMIQVDLIRTCRYNLRCLSFLCSLLTGCAHALLALLYPFEWQVSHSQRM